MLEIRIPEVKAQFAKTEARRRAKEQIVDPETGEIREEYRWVREYVGEGIVRWKEFFERVRDYVQNRTLDECRAMYEHLTGDPCEGMASKKGVAVAYIEWLFGVKLDETKTAAKILTQLLDEFGPSLGRWGLGCPHGCGRFWELKPTADLAKFRPDDDAAMTGPQAEVLEEWEVEVGAEYNEEGNKIKDGVMEKRYRILHWGGEEMVVNEVPVNRGYLEWKSGEFICDRCGEEIKLVT